MQPRRCLPFRLLFIHHSSLLLSLHNSIPLSWAIDITISLYPSLSVALATVSSSGCRTEMPKMIIGRGGAGGTPTTRGPATTCLIRLRYNNGYIMLLLLLHQHTDNNIALVVTFSTSCSSTINILLTLPGISPLTSS